MYQSHNDEGLEMNDEGRCVRLFSSERTFVRQKRAFVIQAKTPRSLSGSMFGKFKQVTSMPVVSSRFSTLLTAHFSPQVALLAALLFESVKNMFMLKSDDGIQFLSHILQLTVECLPYFVAHFWLVNKSRYIAWTGWVAGFFLYPALWFLAVKSWPEFLNWSLLSAEGWLLITGASLGYSLSQHLVHKKRHQRSTLLSKILSLNGAVVAMTVIWACLLAGIFNSTDDAVNNQPLELTIDVGRMMTQFDTFLAFWWQFMIIGMTGLCVYAINRYVLIRQALATHGVFVFAAASLIAIIILTPILAKIILLLPMNIASWTFLPSENHNAFDPVNFQVCFAVLAISTPVILAFERQSHDKALTEVARQQVKTELKLLQQQINPHFLFNTLNNLYALTLKQSKQAPDMLMRLANLLRYTVYEGGKAQVTLTQELDYLRDYVALQEIRNGEKCDVSLSFPDHTDQWLLPPLMLINVLENAFKHGVEPSRDESSVTVTVKINAGRLLFDCVNTLPFGMTETSSGIGLVNLKRRLELVFPDNNQLVSQQRDNLWYTHMAFELTPC